MKSKPLPTLLLVLIATQAKATEHVVQARPDLSFSPAELAIVPGDTVKFENAGGFHNVRQVESEVSTTAVAGGFCAPLPGCLASGAAWSSAIAFPSAGVFHYLCEVHGSAMRGKITVAADQPPIAASKSVQILEDTPSGILLEGTDPDGTVVVIELDPAAGPAHGLLMNFDGASVTYQPAQDYTGPDSFGFLASSGGLTAAGTISIDVMPDPAVNDAPAVPAYRMVTTAAGVAVPVVLEGSDPDGDALAFHLVADEQPRHGRVVGTPPNVVYEPDDGFFGYDRFAYRAEDDSATSETGDIVVRVTRPSAPRPSRLFAVPETEPGAIVEIGQGVELRRFAAPCALPTAVGQDGLAFDGTYLWALCNATSQVLQLDPDTGETVRSMAIDGGPFDGLALGTRLLLNRSSDHVLQIRSSDTGVLEYQVQYGASVGATGAISGFPGGGSILMSAGVRVVLYDPTSNVEVDSFDGLDGGSGVATISTGIVTASPGSQAGSRTTHDGSNSSAFPLPYAVRSLAADQGLSLEAPDRYRRVFVAPRDSDTDLVELDPASGQEINRFAAPEATYAMSRGEVGLAFDGESLWFITVDSVVGETPLYRLDPNTGAVRQAIKLGSDTTFDGLAVGGDQVFLFAHATDSVLTVNVESGTQQMQALPAVGDWIGGLGMFAGFNQLLATLDDGQVFRLSPAGLNVEGSFSAFPGPVMGVGALSGEILATGIFTLGEPSSLRFFAPQGTLLREVPLAYNIAALGADDANAGFPLTGAVQKLSGDNQGTALDTGFAQPLRVRVLDVHGNAVAGVPVSFRAPSASGVTFGGGDGMTAVTDLRGEAVSTLPTAGATPGSFMVNAWVAASDIPTTFALSVAEPPPDAIFADGFENNLGAIPKLVRVPTSAKPDGSYP